MKTIFAAALALGALCAPAFAASDDTTCAQFSAMDAEGQMMALHDMDEGMESSGNMMSGDMMAEGDKSGDAMHADSSSGNMMSSSAMMSDDDMVASVAKTCTDHPEMALKDAMHMGAM